MLPRETWALGVEWLPLCSLQDFLRLKRGQAHVEQVRLSLGTETFPGSVQAATPNPIHTHLPASPLQTLRRVQRESARDLDTLVWAWCWLWVV